MGSKAAIVFALAVIAAAFGFLRELATAAVFATSPEGDAFALLLLYVEGVWSVMTYGIAAQVVVPLIVRLDSGGEAAGRNALSALMLWTLLIGAPLVGLCVFFPEWVAAHLAPRFTAAQTQALLPAIVLGGPSCVLLAVAGVMSGALRARAAFYAPVVGRAAFSAIIAALIAGFGHAYGTWAAGTGVLLGAIVLCGLQWVRLSALGWRWSMPRLGAPEVRGVFASAWPVLAALTSTHIILLGAQRAIASDLPVGAFATTSYAQRLLSLASLVTMSVYAVAATDFSREFHGGGLGALRDRALGHLKTLCFVLVPATVLMIVLSRLLVDWSFNRGAYPPSAVRDAGLALSVFALSLVPGAIASLLHLVFSSAHQPRRVLSTSLTFVAATLVLTAALKAALGGLVLAAAFSAGSSVMSVACLVVFARMDGVAAVAALMRYLSAAAVRAAVAAAAGGAAAYLQCGCGNFAAWFVGAAAPVPTLVGAGVFTAVFLIVSGVSRDEGWTRLIGSLTRLRGQVAAIILPPSSEGTV